MTNKFQIPEISIFKTDDVKWFGFFNFQNWDLFEFCHLSFGIYLKSQYSRMTPLIFVIHSNSKNDGSGIRNYAIN